MIVGGHNPTVTILSLSLCVAMQYKAITIDICMSSTVLLCMACRGKLGKKFGEAHAWPLCGVVRDSNPSKLLYS